jgi:2-dehydropantoate 2-reductase
MTKNISDKICVVGIGGVGGYIGGALAREYPHVAFYARGKRKEAILNNGLVVKSECLGNFTTVPEKVSDNAEELGIMDVLFISVKNYSLEQACNEIAPMVGDKTVIIPVMNGTNPGERTRKYLGRGLVIDSLIYVVSSSEEDFTIVQKGEYGIVRIGLKNPTGEEKEAIAKVHGLLTGAGVKCIIEDDIEAAIWKKFVLNCAFNVITAYYSANTGELRNDPGKVEEFRTLLSEACLIGRTKGVNLPETLEKEQVYHFMHNQSDDATSSMRRDVDAGRPNELETFSGYLLEQAREYGVSIPVTERFYNGLKARLK